MVKGPEYTYPALLKCCEKLGTLLLPAFTLALLMTHNTAGQSAYASAGKGSPTSRAAGNGGNTGTAKSAKSRAAGNTLLGLVHIGATNATGKQGGQQTYN
jgi:hypothetical protein